MDPQIDKIFVDPISAVPLIATGCNGFAIAIEQTFISFFAQCLQDRCFMSLARRQVEMERMPICIAEDMNFR